MKVYDFLIVGAGLYGATLARELTDAGYSVLVTERRPHIGGNVYSSKQNGIDVHMYGAHIFHTNDERVWEYVNRFACFNNYVNMPIANFHGEKYHLPFNMNTFKEVWGVTEPEEAKSVIERQVEAAGITEPSNLEEQAISMVGADIFHKLVEGYTEKQWGRKCSELPASIIKRLPVRYTYDNNYFNAGHQGVPVEGYTEMVQSMLSGVEVRLNLDYLKNRRELEALADKVIYTGCIDEFFGYCYGELEYRSLRFENETLGLTDYQGCAVENYTDAETPWTRIIEHKWFSEDEAVRSIPETVITREYPELWEKGKEPYYPINDDRNAALYQKYVDKAAVSEPNVEFGGRLGAYQYYDMDVCIGAALAVSDRIIGR